MKNKPNDTICKWNLNIYRPVLLMGVVVFVLGGLLMACSTAASAPAPSPDAVSETKVDYTGKKVLFVNSYHEGYEWSDGVEAGFQEALEGTGLELKFVRMDTKNNPGDEFGEKAGAQANAEIEAFQPDVVIAVDDNAQKYLVVPYLRDKEIPVVFAGVNWDASIYDYPAKNVTGMVEVELPVQLVDHLKNFAEGERVGYLTVDSETERKVAQIYNDRFFAGEMKEYWVATFDEFEEQYLKAQEEVDILFLGNNAGIDQWDQAEVEAFVLENTTIPTGTINDWMAPYVLITLAKSAEEQGEWSAQAALRIIDGTPVSEIPVAENKKGELILNLNVAEKLDVIFSPSLLRNAEVYSSE